jgi:hypothetical protein
MDSLVKSETVPSTTKQAFRFFDLPRELRNRVYSLLAVPKARYQATTDAQVAWVLKLTAFNFCSPGLLLISRQFKEKYKNETTPYESTPFESSSLIISFS